MRRPLKTRLAPSFLALTLMLSACATNRGVALPPPLTTPAAGASGGPAALAPAPVPGTQFERLAAPPVASRPTPAPEPEPSRPAPRSASASVNFEQVPLTTVIQVVYSDILGRTVQIDPAVMQRRDLVTFRTPPDERAERIEAAIQMVLRSFGLGVIDAGGLVRILPDNAQTGLLPELRRGSALPETPAAMRTIFQLVDLGAVRNTEVANWLKTILGNRITVQEDASRNALLLSGTGANIAAALGVIKELDQPVMAGRSSLRVTPVYWSATELSQALTQVLTAEGYTMPPAAQTAPQSGGIRYPIIVMPVAQINALLVFAVEERTLEHVRKWIERLDQPNQRASGRNIFTYTARHLSADSLARTLSQLIDGTAGAAAPQPQAGTAAPAGGAPPRPPGAGTGPGRVVVDSNSNTLVFNTSPENYSQLIGLLNVLDRPAKSALIEVTVAEVSLTGDMNLGVEWVMQASGARGSTVTASTLDGLGLGSAGLTITRLSGAGDVRLILNALATTNRASILSSPRVLARNGEQARIQVGQQVPIITSQQSSLNASNGQNTGVLQTIQYRDTGVLLEVKPSIYSGDRIDLDVVQEVSAAASTQTGVNNSPTFLTRKVETRLTLEHGATVMLGGLISNDRTNNDSGVPGLKDVPLLGHLFKNQTNRDVRRELIVLITPYVINDGQEASQITEAFRGMLPMLRGAEADTRAPQRSPSGDPSAAPRKAPAP